MKNAMILIFCASLALTGCGETKSVSIPKSGNDKIDAVLLDIASGRKDEAVAKFEAKLETISGLPSQFSSPREFVDSLDGCKFTGFKNMALSVPGFVMTEWSCPSGPIEALLATMPQRQGVTIGDVRAK